MKRLSKSNGNGHNSWIMTVSELIEHAMRRLRKEKQLRVCSKITSDFYKHLLHIDKVKNTQRNSAMLVFLNFIYAQNLAPKFSDLFLSKPLAGYMLNLKYVNSMILLNLCQSNGRTGISQER